MVSKTVAGHSRARNPLGGGHLRPSALLLVEEDIPYRRPPHASLNGRRSPPRGPRDFRHGLVAVARASRTGIRAS